MEERAGVDETGRQETSSTTSNPNGSTTPTVVVIPDPQHVDPPETAAEATSLINLASRCFALAINYLNEREHSALQCLLTSAWIKIQSRQRRKERANNGREDPIH